MTFQLGNKSTDIAAKFQKVVVMNFGQDFIAIIVRRGFKMHAALHKRLDMGLVSCCGRP